MALQKKTPNTPPLLQDILSRLDRLAAVPMEFLTSAWDKMQNLPRTNFELGCDLAARGKLGDAIFRFRVTTWLEPRHYMAWYNLGCCRLEEGRADLAIEAFRKALSIYPSHEEARFMLSTIEGVKLAPEMIPHSMPLSLVTNHFDNLAADFTQQQLDQMDYRGHVVMYEAVMRHLDKNRTDYAMLELGIGSGICGPIFRPHCIQLEGVELSRNMAAVAGELRDATNKKIYDHIHLADARKYLAHVPPLSFDVIFAANVLNFIGELSAVFDGVAKALKPGGLFAFSTDIGKGSSFGLVQALGRFAHSPDYLRQQAARAGLQELELQEAEIYPGFNMLQAVFQKPL